MARGSKGSSVHRSQGFKHQGVLAGDEPDESRRSSRRSRASRSPTSTGDRPNTGRIHTGSRPEPARWCRRRPRSFLEVRQGSDPAVEGASRPAVDQRAGRVHQRTPDRGAASPRR